MAVLFPFQSAILTPAGFKGTRFARSINVQLNLLILSMFKLLLWLLALNIEGTRFCEVVLLFVSEKVNNTSHHNGVPLVPLHTWRLLVQEQHRLATRFAACLLQTLKELASLIPLVFVSEKVTTAADFW